MLTAELPYGKIRLNSSVQPPDVNRLKGHVQRLYRLFLTGYRLDIKVSTSAVMNSGKGQYGSQLWTLRRVLIPMGWCIDDVGRTEDGQHYYKLVPLSESAFYAEREEELRGLTQ